MKTDVRLEGTREAGHEVDDRELRDEQARSAARPGWYAVIVVVDVLAILAFFAWVVVPRFS